MRGPKVKITSGGVDTYIFIDDSEIKEINAYVIRHSASGQPVLYLKTVPLGGLDFEGRFNEVYDIDGMLKEHSRQETEEKCEQRRKDRHTIIMSVFFSALGILSYYLLRFFSSDFLN